MFVSLSGWTQDDLQFSEIAGEDNTVQIVCKNNSPASYSIRLAFNLRGMKSTLSDGEIVVVPGYDEVLLTTLKATGASWGYGFSSDYVMGNVFAQHDDQHVYALPFSSPSKHRVMQGYFGRFSHQGSRAIDWEMDIGTPVYSMRAGIVVDFRENSKVGCTRPRCIDQSNFIKIEHEDGTIADYAHLKYNGVAVELGQHVEQGHLIGYSGNTGWSSGPHLHTKVFVSTFGSRPEGVVTKFKIKDQEVVPEENKAYQH